MRIDLYTYYKLFKARVASEEWLKNWIFKGRPKRKARAPRGSGIIVKMDFQTRAKGFVYDGENKLDELWERRGYSIPADDFVVYLDIDAKPYKAYAYPASVVFINVQRLVLSASQRRIFTLSPERRIAKTFAFAKKLLSEPFRINNVVVRIDTSKLVTTDVLRKEGKIREVGIVEEPKLRFHNNVLGLEPKELRFKGPYSGEKKLRIVYVVPEAHTALVKPFHRLLNQSFKSLRLGRLIYSGEILVRGRPTEKSYRAAGKVAANKLAEIEEGEKKITLVLVPRRGKEKHQFIKGMVDRRSLNNRRIQFLRLQTARKALDGQEFVLRNLALQLYLKSEERGEAMWILDSPAGKVGNTLYAGFDVTRETKKEYDEETKEIISERKEATAVAAVCDSRGLLVLMRSLISSTGEILTPNTVSELFRSMVQRGEISLSKFDEKPNRVVLFKDGKVYKKTDLPNVRAGYRKVKSEFPGLSFDLISVVKGGIYRIYTLDNKNSPRGTYVLFNDKVALINASQLTYQKERVTANPKRIEVAFSSQGVDVKQIVMEFFDLTVLDWASLLVPISTAIPLKLVQNLGEYLREDIYVPEHINYIVL